MNTAPLSCFGLSAGTLRANSLAKLLNSSDSTFVRRKRVPCRNAATSHSPGRANRGADSRVERCPGFATLQTSPSAVRAATSSHEPRRETITSCPFPRGAARLVVLAGPHPGLRDISPSGKCNDDQEEKDCDKPCGRRHETVGDRPIFPTSKYLTGGLTLPTFAA